MLQSKIQSYVNSSVKPIPEQALYSSLDEMALRGWDYYPTTLNETFYGKKPAEKIEKAMLSADLLVFTSPAYVMHTTGAMKAMLDHFGYRWMPHRPAKEMFGKRAVIITQCLGAGDKSAAKDIKDSLSWWGISSIKVVRFRFLGDVKWERIADKKRRSMEDGVKSLALKMKNIDYSKPAHTKIPVKFKFLAVRSMQTELGKDNPEYRDFKYWKEQGWLDKKRPWKYV